MGTDLRKIILDGYPARHVFGCDLLYRFIELGYELYSDKSTCEISFITDAIQHVDESVMVPPSLDSITTLNDLRGRVDHLFTSSVFHLFDEEGQADMAYRLALLSSRKDGSIIFGRHLGHHQTGVHETKWAV